MPANRRILLARRPEGAPRPEDFRVQEAPIPAPGPGRVLTRTLWLSLDPYMRGRMSAGPSYAPALEPGDVMPGETIGEVLRSESPDFAPGDIVRGFGNWQTHAVLPAAELRRIDPGAAPVQTRLGILGMPGFTAYAGLRAIGRPRAGETLVVGAASGPVGGLAGQIARLEGCRVVGVAGGADKCAFVEQELGFDRCLDRKAPDLGGRLEAACPDGVDIYMELTGGAVRDAVLPLLNMFARIPVIGMVAQYNAAGPADGPDRSPSLWRQILTRRLTLRGMIVRDFADLEPDFERDVGRWLGDGRLRYREDVVEGLDEAPAAFIGMLEGRNFGKLLVHVG